ITSIERPSRRVRASATEMRYWGLRILPSRVSLIFTAMVKRFLLWVSRCNSATRAGRPDPVLPRVCDRRAVRTGNGRAADSRLLCQNAIVERKSVAIASAAQPGAAGRHHRLRLLDLLVDLRFDAAGHPPALGSPHELVVVPEAAEKHLILVARKHH